MSELAAEYYNERARRLIIDPIPDLLNGRQIILLDTKTEPLSNLPSAFAERTRPIESFVLDGVLGVLLSAEEGLTVSRWGAIRKLPRYGCLKPAEGYAEHVVAKDLSAAFPSSGGEVVIESVARSEVPDKAFARATNYFFAARNPKQEDAQVYLLTRAMGEDPGHCYAANLTIVWGDYREGGIIGRMTSFLTPHYLGCGLLTKELEALPPIR